MALMKDQSSQYLWIDSTTLPVCKNQRIQRHKFLAKIASRGKSMAAKLYADRGDVSEDLKSRLKDQVKSIDLMTYHRKEMRSVQLSVPDEHHLKQRNKIEMLFSLLKG
ncbi:hypothetical protein AMD27_15000 [Acinetobacter sp. TGL-Y2]|nr:hypothetical protein AMD27_15000 [Acinetobacter sp. TGL-Y2]